MVSKSQKKLIRSLKQKKYRKQHRLFVVEGVKVINEFLDTHFVLKNLFVLSSELSYFSTVKENKLTIVSSLELSQLTFLTAPQKAIAIFEIYEEKEKSEVHNGLQIVLDDVKDPGNLGTIIRLCDWFGIDKLICSNETVDCFNPKVIQATMGSLTRISIEYRSIREYILASKLPVLGTFMDGDNVYKISPLPKTGIIVMGNEANGISKSVENLVTQRIAIPRFGDIQKTESLNVATATAILLSEFKRNS